MSDGEAESTQQQQQGSDSKQTPGGDSSSSSSSSSGEISGIKKILLFVGIIIVLLAYIVDCGAYVSESNSIGWGIQGTVEILLPALLGLVLVFKSGAVNTDITTFVIFFVGLGAALWSFFAFVALCRLNNKSSSTKTHIAGCVGFFVGEVLITIVGAMGLF